MPCSVFKKPTINVEVHRLCCASCFCLAVIQDSRIDEYNSLIYPGIHTTVYPLVVAFRKRPYTWPSRAGSTSQTRIQKYVFNSVEERFTTLEKKRERSGYFQEDSPRSLLRTNHKQRRKEDLMLPPSNRFCSSVIKVK